MVRQIIMAEDMWWSKAAHLRQTETEQEPEIGLAFVRFCVIWNQLY